MLITRISGCKGTTFLLFYKELRNLFIDFAQPFLQFACPLPLVDDTGDFSYNKSAGGVCGVTCSSLEYFCSSSFDGFLPNRLS